jgi:predicted nuclease with TOPRIM domain
MTGFITSALVSVAVLGQQPTPQPDSTAALVQELRALRVAVEQMLAANVRVQLLMGRLQLQETRIISLSRQSTDMEAQLTSLRLERDGIAMQQKVFAFMPDKTEDPKEREEAKRQAEALAGRLKEIDTRYLALQNEQANIQQTIATEQNRWGDFNQRLEELERLLGAVRR